jgi:hypothetical protein
MQNPGKNIKTLSVVLFILSLISSGIWFVILVSTYIQSLDMPGNKTTSLVIVFGYPACIILGGIVCLFLMYGFGQLVENSEIMVLNQRNMYISSEFDNLRETLSNVEIQKRDSK